MRNYLFLLVACSAQVRGIGNNPCNGLWKESASEDSKAGPSSGINRKEEIRL